MSSSETNAVKPAFNPIKILEGTSPVVRVMVGIALVGLIMVLISWAAPVLTPILLAGYLAAICAPVYFWLQRKGVNEHLALILLVVVVVLVVVFMAALLGISANRMTQGILKYQADLGGAEMTVENVLTSLGLQESDLNEVLTSEKVTSVLMGILGAIGDFAGDLLFSVVLIAFFLLEAKRFLRLAETQLSDRPFFGELPEVAKSAVTYFGIRTRLNLATGVGIGVILFILGVDYPVLWGVLAFVLSYVPYIGLIVAGIPPAILAMAEHGLGRALMVAIAIVIVNLAIENIVEPNFTGKTLSLSPTVVLLSFFFWGWLLGSTGALLSMPITVGIMLVTQQDDRTRWISELMGTSESKKE